LRDLALLGIALFWLGSGVYVVTKPGLFLKNTQFPWTKLPVWGARLLGVVFLLGGLVMLQVYVRHNLN